MTILLNKGFSMHRFFRFTCTAVLMLSPAMVFPAQAKDIVVDSRVSAATIYNDRASVTRSATVEIPAGEHVLIFNGLPLSIFTNSLRADGKSKAEVMFGALAHKRESSETYVVPREKELNLQIEALQDQIKVHNADKQALNVGRAFLESLGKNAALRTDEEIAKLELEPQSWGAAADSLSMKMAANLKEDLALGFKIRDANNKIQKLRNDLRGLRTGQKQSYSVSLPFEADKPSTLSVDLSYQISNVSWEPIYDARLDVKTGALQLVQYGSVWQRTGEDWDDVSLTLSTAQPSRGAGLPDLNTHWLSIYEARKKHSRQVNNFADEKSMAASAPLMKRMMESDSIMEAMPAMVEDKEVSFQSAQINTDGFVGEYKITGPATVKADGTKAKLLVGSFDTDSKLQVQVKPQISTDAYLVAKTTLKGEAPVLPGQINLFRDGAYIGQSYMSMLRPGDEADLAFGIDDNVTVKRNVLMDESSESGLITKDSIIERHYVTKVKNLHKDDVEVAVLETVPASTDERIRVEIIKDKTTAGYKSDLDDIKGLTRWAGIYKPQQETSVMLGWRVSWPKGQSISGL